MVNASCTATWCGHANVRYQDCAQGTIAASACADVFARAVQRIRASGPEASSDAARFDLIDAGPEGAGGDTDIRTEVGSPFLELRNRVVHASGASELISC